MFGFHGFHGSTILLRIHPDPAPPSPGHAPFRDACRAPPGRAKDAEFYAAGPGILEDFLEDFWRNDASTGGFEVFFWMTLEI